MSPRTQDAYVRSVYQLAKHYHKSPELLTRLSGFEQLKLASGCKSRREFFRSSLQEWFQLWILDE